MIRIVLLLAGILYIAVLCAQQPASPPPPPAPATTIRQAFRQGQFSGGFRSFWMATDNARQLSDYYAWAVGGSLQFQTASWRGFRLGIGGAFNFNLLSSDLEAKDSLTGAANRYEIGLFDVENPSNRRDLDRLEELWLRYQWKKSRITLGQQLLQTPLINHQDGRMRPTAEAGVWLESEALPQTRIEGGWLWKISPRSTVRWYGIGESIGLYPKGLNPDGTGSGYPAHLKSAGIGLLGITQHWGKRAKVQLWDQYVDNIFNTVLAQVDYTQPLRKGHGLLFGLQYTAQQALAEGGNPDARLAYFQKGGRSSALSMQAGWQRQGWQALAAYTRIGASGRFLSPREWGREPFYTVMSRERVEGSGDVQAATARLSWQNASQKLRLELAYGRFYLPDLRRVALNKYAFPAFQQVNIDLRYTFGGAWEGLRAQLLYVWKGRLGEVYGQDKYVINRVDVSLYNLILNYTF